MRYKIIKADLEKHGQDIIDFWKRNFPSWPKSKYDWFYRFNHYGPAHVWLALDIENNDKVVGATAMFPKKIRYRGNYLKVVIAGDFGVEKEHRGTGSARMLTDKTLGFLAESEFAIVYATPNIASEKVSVRSGYDVVGHTVRMVRVLRTHDYMKRYLKLGLLAKIAAAPTDWLMNMFTKYKKYRNIKGYRNEVLDRFDSRFDELWDSAKDNFPMMGERTSDYLNWRFADCPFKEFKTFALINDKNKVVGYIVYRMEGDNALISDIFATDFKETLEVLLGKFTLFQKEQRSSVITLFYFGNSALTDMFYKFGYSLRADKRSIIVQSPDESSYREIATNKNLWHFLEGDNDT